MGDVPQHCFFPCQSAASTARACSNWRAWLRNKNEPSSLHYHHWDVMNRHLRHLYQRIDG